MDIRKLQRTIVDALEDVKAQDIQVFNTEALTSLFDRVIIATGSSNRQTRALAASVRDRVKAAGGEVRNAEGDASGEWVLVDCGDAVVHLMQPMIRAYYRLEDIWGGRTVHLKRPDGSAPTAGAAKKVAAKKVAAKKVPAKKVPAKTTASKTTTSKATTSKATASKTTTSKATASKTTASKTTASKTTASKTAATKTAAAKRATSRAPRA